MFVAYEEKMDSPKTKGKKWLISKTWERCKSFSGGIGRKGNSSGISNALKLKSKSWSHGLTVRDNYQDQEKESRKRKNGVVPEGCFSIYVGSNKQRFVIKTEYVNHPLFKVLLEEAESEYGFSSEGPLMLPCEVDEFVKVLMEMDSEEEIGGHHQQGCRFVARSHSSYHILSTPPRLAANLY